jgi:uncharacterized protein YdhG (YjbR/CyaY superfamily)
MVQCLQWVDGVGGRVRLNAHLWDACLMPAKTVDEFLGALPAPQGNALERLRKQIHAAAPGATELINYGVPMLRLDGRNLVSFGAGRDHCAFYVQSRRVMKAFANDLAKLDTATSTIRFQPDKPLRGSLVKRIVKARIAENQAIAEGRVRAPHARRAKKAGTKKR